VHRLPFIALLADFDVEEFEKELREKGLLAPADPPARESA